MHADGTDRRTDTRPMHYAYRYERGQRIKRLTDLSLNSTGPTPTPTPTCPLGMRLSCNFVNVYTIVDHVQYTYTCKRAHSQRTSSRGKARVRTACRCARRTRRLPREDPRTEVGEEVRVDVGVGPVECSYYPAQFRASPEMQVYIYSRENTDWRSVSS